MSVHEFRRRAQGGLRRVRPKLAEVGGTTHRVIRHRAGGRPFGHHREVGRQAPRTNRFEHVVLQHEVIRVCPVVRDLPRVVPAHGVGLTEPPRVGGAVRAEGVGRAVRVVAFERGRDEPVHGTAVDVPRSVELAVRAALVDQGRVVERLHAGADPRVRHADVGASMPHRDAVRPGVRSEIGIEPEVLLHDHDHVLDLVDPLLTGLRGHQAGAASRHEREARPSHGEPSSRRHRSDHHRSEGHRAFLDGFEHGVDRSSEASRARCGDGVTESVGRAGGARFEVRPAPAGGARFEVRPAPAGGRVSRPSRVPAAGASPCAGGRGWASPRRSRPRG
jgi:hypothetical protein